MREAMKVAQSAETNATLIRWLSILSLALLAPFLIGLVIILVAAANTPPPAPCHALVCGSVFAQMAVPSLVGFCVAAPTVGGLLAGALAWLQGIGQAIRQRSGFWLIGLLLSGFVAIAPIMVLVAVGRAVLPFGITPAWDSSWDLLSIPLLAILVALVTLLFAIVGVPAPARQAAQTAKTRETVEEAGV